MARSEGEGDSISTRHHRPSPATQLAQVYRIASFTACVSRSAFLVGMSLRGKLVYLRALALDDFKTLAPHLGDHIFQTRTGSGVPSTDWLAARMVSLERTSRSQSLEKVVKWAVCAIEDERLIGYADVRKINTHQRSVSFKRASSDRGRLRSVQVSCLQSDREDSEQRP